MILCLNKLKYVKVLNILMNWKEKSHYESKVLKMLNLYRHFGCNRFELIYLIVRRLVPEMVEKPRLWEKILKKVK